MQNLFAFILQHWALCGMLLLMILLLLHSQYQTEGGGISAQNLIKQMNAGHVSLIDLRGASAFDQGHIISSICIKANLESIKQHIKATSKKTWVLVCEDGRVSLKHSKMLIQNGLKVTSLTGGMIAWREENLPLLRATSGNSV